MTKDHQAIIAQAYRQRDEFVAQGLRNLFSAILGLVGVKRAATPAA